MKLSLTLDRSMNIMRSWGYSRMTELQKTALSLCVYGGGARELVVGDTSSGKTLVPVVAFQAYREAHSGGRLLYILPYRALATQKLAELESIFPELDIKVSTSEFCASDASISEGSCDIAIIIYEKAALFQSRSSGFLRRYSHIIFDETGIVESAERGFKADYLLNHACRNPNSNLYLLATPYYDWDPYITCYGFQERRETSRPVSIETSAVLLKTKPAEDAGGRKDAYKQYREALEQERLQEIAGLCKKHLAGGRKILIFANNRAYVRELSHALNAALYGTGWKQEFSITQGRRKLFDKLDMSDADILSVFGQDEDIIAYYHGITFHNASLPEGIREKIEDDFLNENGTINIVCATETLAFGLNSNVDTVIIARMEKKDGGSVRLLTVNEYRNYIGRSGRLGSREKGYGHAICAGEQEYEHWASINASPGNVEQLHNSFEEDRLNAENMLMFLHFYDNGKTLSTEQLVETIGTFPTTVDRTVLRSVTESASAALEQRGLIRSCFDEMTLEDGCKITDLGRSILGYIIDKQTYDTLAQRSGYLFGESVPLFDFLYEICQCSEVSVVSGSRIRQPAERHKQIMLFLERLLSEGNISPKLYARITSAKSLSFFKAGNIGNGRFKKSPQQEDWQFLYGMLFLRAMYSWTQSVDLSKIYHETGVEYEQILHKSIKIKYIIDAMLNAFSSGVSRDAYTRMELIGVSCYYGVRPDVLADLMQRKIVSSTSEIEPVDGRQLRMVSQVLNSLPAASGGNLSAKIQRCRNIKKPYYMYLKEKCNFRG